MAESSDKKLDSQLAELAENASPHLRQNVGQMTRSLTSVDLFA